MVSHSVAVIGTGDPTEGAGIAYGHADAYASLDDCELLACADVVPENAAAFADEYGIPDGNVYADYRRMLDDVAPDVVSVCTSTRHHADIVVGAARTGVPRAIHSEKPMADTWGGARLMAQEAWRRGIQLTFNHQRRFGDAWREAKALLEEGAIGDLRRVETGAPNLLDWGTHAVDLCHYFAGESPAEWVIGNVDYRTEQINFGVHHENQGLAHWAYESGVHGVAATGTGSDAVGALNRLVGTRGEIEVHIEDGPDLRVHRAGDAAPESFDYDDGFSEMVRRGIADLLASLEGGTEPELSARRALAATEVLFGAYESARRRGRVEFPLAIDDHPLEAMVESGELTPVPPESSE